MLDIKWKKQSSSLHVLNHYRWFDFRRFSSLGMENFIKGEYGAIETKEEVYFSLWIKTVLR
jgi:hypothetical protein